MKGRVIIQITTGPCGTKALCNDGTLWRYKVTKGTEKWIRLTDVPQP